MALTVPPVPAPLDFACKTWMSYQIESNHLGHNYYVWFSQELNPIANGDASNPLELYRMIDRAVKQTDVNHPKLKDLKASQTYLKFSN